MQAGKKYYTYRSTMLGFTDFFDFLEKSKVSERDIDVISMLWHVYSISALLRSSYFQIIRIGDKKYELTVQRYVTDSYVIKLTITNE